MAGCARVCRHIFMSHKGVKIQHKSTISMQRHFSSCQTHIDVCNMYYSYQSGATMTAPKCETIYKALFSIYFWRGAHTRLVLTTCMSTSYSLQWQSRVGAKALKLFIRMHQICEHLSKHYT